MRTRTHTSMFACMHVQWFGNMATMRWWDDLWLNEGFASCLMYMAMDHIYPQWNVVSCIAPPL